MAATGIAIRVVARDSHVVPPRIARFRAALVALLLVLLGAAA